MTLFERLSLFLWWTWRGLRYGETNMFPGEEDV